MSTARSLLARLGALPCYTLAINGGFIQVGQMFNAGGGSTATMCLLGSSGAVHWPRPQYRR